jgi:hypothetical protein
MKILVAGCSFSSGWGVDRSWVDILGETYDVKSVAVTGSSNFDIFIQALKNINESYDLVLIQFTALNRITVSPSPINSNIVITSYDSFLSEAIPSISKAEIKGFIKVLSMLNQDWKHYFNLIDMINILQKNDNILFINGLLPWDENFFILDDNFLITTYSKFANSLLQPTEFDDNVLKELLTKVIEVRNTIDTTRWVNLYNNWNNSKIDVVSNTDQHPGPRSQELFADQVQNTITKYLHDTQT